MHRAAAAAAATFQLAVHFRHDGVGRDAARQSMAMLPISRDDGVFRLQRLHRADRHRLFADIEVDEAANLAGSVKFDALLFETANAQHLAQQKHCMLAVKRRLFR